MQRAVPRATGRHQARRRPPGPAGAWTGGRGAAAGADRFPGPRVHHGGRQPPRSPTCPAPSPPPSPPCSPPTPAAVPRPGRSSTGSPAWSPTPRPSGSPRARGLQFVNVLWEDTGRYQGSSVGPNISDVTIEVVDGAGPRPPPGAHAGPALPQLRRPDRRREARQGLGPHRQPARRRPRAGGDAARPAGQPVALPLAPRQRRHPRRHAAGPARQPRAGLGAGRLPAGAPRRRRHLPPGDLQLPVHGRPPRRPLHPGDPPGHLDVDRRQRPRPARHRELGAAALLQRRRPAGPAHRRAALRRGGERRHHERRVGRQPRRGRQPAHAHPGAAAGGAAAPPGRVRGRRPGADDGDGVQVGRQGRGAPTPWSRRCSATASCRAPSPSWPA